MSEYNHNLIEDKWQKFWSENQTYKTKEDNNKEKFYTLDMFPYPSGAGLHVGHPLGYIASDIIARYKRNKGYNVLHPAGYDSFGLPAEQYAIKTGQHPSITTQQNIARYRKQLDRLGFALDWSREVQTSDPSYYKWTQWIFKQIFNSWYNKETDKAEDIKELISIFNNEGNINVKAVCDNTPTFTSEEWNSWSENKKQEVLMNYRLAYLADSWVNWCPELGTVLANDEIKDGVSERGGYPIEQKLMRQWNMRITAYAERLLKGLDKIDFSESLKEQQKNWIGKSTGASVFFKIEGHQEKIEVFTTRPDTIFGVSFMVLAPEHKLVSKITTEKYKSRVEKYKELTSSRTERDRQSDVKNITGEFTGAYAINPLSKEKIQIWISDYVLATYGTGAVMSVPAGDQRDWDFAKHFDINITNIFKDVDISESAYSEKDAILKNSSFLNGLTAKEGIIKAINEIELKKIGKSKVNYRLREAVFSRQRYWGEPFPIYYKEDIPYVIEDDKLPITLPKVDSYLPTKEGKPPLARAKKEDWNVFEGDRMEYNTMPGWAGSSWYFLRYMDPNNIEKFVGKDKSNYWNQVDLYIGGAEHATGHLLYSRFWTKFLYDRGFINFNEPFKKLINQGMILGRSNFVYKVIDENKIVSKGLRKNYKTQKLNIDIKYVEDNVLNIDKAKNDPLFSYLKDVEIVLEEGKYICGSEIEKMSKSKYNVQTPDDLCEKYGADSLRCYEMFLGPLEQAKPWDIKGINGVNNFLKKLWRLFPSDNSFDKGEATKDTLKILHKTIKKVTEDIERYSFNTVVSTLMIAVNELGAKKCKNYYILKELTILVSPFAPHIAEELWEKLGNKTSVTVAKWPKFEDKYMVEDNFSYPVSFNGKMRFKLDMPVEADNKKIEEALFKHEKTEVYLKGQQPKKIIIVPKRIINVVL